MDCDRVYKVAVSKDDIRRYRGREAHTTLLGESRSVTGDNTLNSDTLQRGSVVSVA